MSLAERAGLALLGRIDPERAHALALAAIRAGLAPGPGPVTSPRLRVRLAGMDLPNPVGLAAGFDKNAIAVDALARAGFGWIEVGAATPRPQAGNPRPRLWRVPEARAAINRFGFNNDGAEAIAARLAARRRGGVPVGLNLGANADSAVKAHDFARVLALCGPHLDFATINVSSPNTAGLRQLQAAVALRDIIAVTGAARTRGGLALPLFLKVSPDLSPEDVETVAGVALEGGVDGIVATNTTLAREGVPAAWRDRPGGLSGAPLKDRACAVLAGFHRATAGRLPLVGVGGIASAEDAYARIRAGASAVQLYTALTYEGLSLAARIASGLDRLLARDGFEGVAEAVGTQPARDPAAGAAAASSAG